MRTGPWLTALVLASALACAPDAPVSPTPDPVNPGPIVPVPPGDLPVRTEPWDVSNGIFRAEIHGSLWTATDTVIVTRSDDFLELTSTSWPHDEPMVVVLRIALKSTMETQSLGTDGDGSELRVIRPDHLSRGWDDTWSSRFPASTGELRVTYQTGKRIAGTFSGFISDASGSLEWLFIANGRFDIAF